MNNTHNSSPTAPRRQKPRFFLLSRAIKTRRALRFAARLNIPLSFASRMTLAKAEKLTTAAFAI